MTDFSHLDALTSRLQSEKRRLSEAQTDGEKKLRSVWIKQIEKEIAAEKSFIPEMTDDELLAELRA